MTNEEATKIFDENFIDKEVREIFKQNTSYYLKYFPAHPLRPAETIPITISFTSPPTIIFNEQEINDANILRDLKIKIAEYESKFST